jgi:hypothetical protein
MTRPAKIVVVAGGYAVALVIAFAVVRAHVMATSGPDRQGAPGMYGFGDDLLFLGVLAVAAIPAIGAALFFLRPLRAFWRVASLTAIAIAMTAIAAVLGDLLPLSTDTTTVLGAWSALAPLRILAAPLFGIVFFLSGLFAPTRASRLVFLAATAIEAGVFVWVVLGWRHALF